MSLEALSSFSGWRSRQNLEKLFMKRDGSMTHALWKYAFLFVVCNTRLTEIFVASPLVLCKSFRCLWFLWFNFSNLKMIYSESSSRFEKRNALVTVTIYSFLQLSMFRSHCCLSNGNKRRSIGQFALTVTLKKKRKKKEEATTIRVLFMEDRCACWVVSSFFFSMTSLKPRNRRE